MYNRVLLIACGFFALQAQPVRSSALLILDSWWNADYARLNCENAKQWSRDNATIISQLGCNNVTSCVEMRALQESCEPNSQDGLTSFENRLVTELASNQDCSGIDVGVYHGPEQTQSNDWTQKVHWSLSINFFGGKVQQHWQMILSDLTRYSNYAEGDGDVHSIAKDVCAILKQKGAKILN